MLISVTHLTMIIGGRFQHRIAKQVRVALTKVSGLALLPVRHIGFERAPAQCALALSAAHLHTAHELFNSEYFLVFSRTFSVYNVDLK